MGVYSWEEAFGMEHPSYQKNTLKMSVIQPSGHSKMGYGRKGLSWWY